ncbi:hypothetical protein ABW20_dc0100516 [Dactylellina cionopaga]|nr:hypothetical protein ABW20_dc0100516 [Dactylellina cionopaga]
MFFQKREGKKLASSAPELPRLSIESAAAAARNSPIPTSTTVSTTSMKSSAFSFTPVPSPPPAYLSGTFTYEKQNLGQYMTPRHAQGMVTEIESVYEVHEMSLIDSFQAYPQIRMTLILLLSFIIIGGIAAGVSILSVRKA